jgi:hypothetical protein
MKLPIGLALAASAALLSVVPAQADSPPKEVRLFYITANDEISNYIDFGSLDRGDKVIRGWALNVFTPAKTLEGVDEPVGGYWESFGGDCKGKAVYSYGIAMLDADDALLSKVYPQTVKRDAGPGSFDEALLKRVCAKGEPTDEPPFNSLSDAANAARTARDIFDDEED